MTKSITPTRPVVEIYDFNDSQYRVPAANMRWSSHYGPEGSGFGYFTFRVYREIGYNEADVQIGYRVILRKYLFTILFDGKIAKVNEVSSDTEYIEVTALGWLFVFGNDVFNRVYADTRLDKWRTLEEGHVQFCRLWDNSASAYVNLDGHCGYNLLDEAELLGQTSDYLYFGANMSFGKMYIDLTVGGSYGGGANLTWQYWNGSAWTTMGFVTDGTLGLAQDGQVLPNVPSDWAKTTVDSQEAYWIRVETATVTTVAKVGIMTVGGLSPGAVVFNTQWKEGDDDVYGLRFEPRRGATYSPYQYARARYTFEFEENVRTFQAAYDVGLPGSYPGRLEIRISTGIVWSTEVTGSGTISLSPFSGIEPWLEVRFYVTASIESVANEGEVYANLTDVEIRSVSSALISAHDIASDIVDFLGDDVYYCYRDGVDLSVHINRDANAASDLIQVITDYLSFGCLRPFWKLHVAISTAGSYGTLTWEYWNGVTWSSLSVTDGTNGFSVDGTISFAPPSDWKKSFRASDYAYFIRVKAASVGTVAQIGKITMRVDHGLSSSKDMLDDPNRSLVPCYFEDDSTPGDVMTWCSQFGGYGGGGELFPPVVWGVELNDRRRVFLKVISDFVDEVDYVVKRGSASSAAGSDWPASSQMMYGIYTDKTGAIQRTSDVVDDVVIDEKLGGAFVRKAFRLDNIADSDLIDNVLSSRLEENSLPTRVGRYRIAGHVYTDGGIEVPVEEVKATGRIIIFDDFRAREARLEAADFRTGFTAEQVVAVEIDYDGRQATITPGSARGQLERYLAYLALLAER